MSTKKPYSFRFDVKLMEKIEKIAVEEHRNTTNLIETIMIKYVKNYERNKKAKSG